MQKDLQILSWVIRGKQRREIIIYLGKPKMPIEVAKDSGYSLNHASKVLREFSRAGIAKLLNPQDKTGRLYQLTDVGVRIQKLVKERS